jgi:Icc-related predicted phosphoesterase
MEARGGLMEYSLVSDLHADFHGGFTAPLKELVIVAGDTANSIGKSCKLLDAMRARGHKVFAIPGNHEHYIGLHDLQQAERVFETMGYGNPRLFIGDGFNIIGVNGWYRINDEEHWRGYMRDQRYLTAEDVNEAAQEQAAFVDDHLSASNVPCIVVTHTAPCMETLDPRFEGSDGNDYFWNPYMRPLLAKHADKIAVWHHGHTHNGTDQIVDGVRIITNPRGYPGENPTWQPIHLSTPAA